MSESLDHSTEASEQRASIDIPRGAGGWITAALVIPGVLATITGCVAVVMSFSAANWGPATIGRGIATTSLVLVGLTAYWGLVYWVLSEVGQRKSGEDEVVEAVQEAEVQSKQGDAPDA